LDQRLIRDLSVLLQLLLSLINVMLQVWRIAAGSALAERKESSAELRH
jgi:hypothetical protein